MSALSDVRVKTKQEGTGPINTGLSIPVKGGVKIWQGALVVINAGFAAPGTAATGLIAVGRADETVDNTSGSDGAVRVKVRPGTFTWDNATSTDACAAADRGKTVYVLDDHTVTITSTGHSAAGKLVDIDADGQCLVLMGLSV